MQDNMEKAWRVSTHSRPKAAGKPALPMPARKAFQLTAARRRLALPALQHDKHNAEDVDSAMEDHAPDTLRYLCMTRVIAAPAPKKGSLRPEWLQFKPVA